jgi:hypothetical protein
MGPNNGADIICICVEDKEFLKQHIFGSLDEVLHDKLLVSSIENVIYNIAQCDYSTWTQILGQNILSRLQAKSE